MSMNKYNILMDVKTGLYYAGVRHGDLSFTDKIEEATSFVSPEHCYDWEVTELEKHYLEEKTIYIRSNNNG
jgi:hypothetical protein